MEPQCSHSVKPDVDEDLEVRGEGFESGGQGC